MNSVISTKMPISIDTALVAPRAAPSLPGMASAEANKYKPPKKKTSPGR